MPELTVENLLSGEFYCERIADMTLAATEAVLHSMQGIYDGEDEAYEKPDFLAQEVTGERRYYNSALRLYPYKKWSEEEKHPANHHAE